MMKRKIFIFLFNGFSDWEIAFLTPEIKKSEEFESGNMVHPKGLRPNLSRDNRKEIIQ